MKMSQFNYLSLNLAFFNTIIYPLLSNLKLHSSMPSAQDEIALGFLSS